MQLTVIVVLMMLMVWAKDLKGQVRSYFGDSPTDSLRKDSGHIELSVYDTPEWKKVDVDFLSSYYQQDGNNSPVTGGIGTEYLTDFTQKIIISAPLSPKLTFQGDLGYDAYTSASTDKIDPLYSDESGEDVRIHGNLGLSYQLDSSQTIGARIGGSNEYDYNSFQVGLNYTWLSKDQNTAVDIRYQSFFDQWDLIYPIELRGKGPWVNTKNRQSHNLSVGLQRVMDKKTQVALQVEGTYMNGLLSTPFHRVYFQNEALPKVEKLPSTRFKVPVGIRLNRYLNQWMIARLYYRFYWDNWGVRAHTAQVELPIKINRFLAVVPSYRFHTQTAAKYFAPYGQHQLGDAFYTSDYDLSALSSHSFGVGLNYQPAGGIFHIVTNEQKGKGIQLDNIDLRYAHYMRSTGLNANIVSFGLGFTIR